MRSIFSFWRFDILTSVLMMLLSLLYLYAVNLKLKKRSLYFLSGMVLLLICVSSPLHFIGEHYLFSAHMVTHVLILLIAAPLIVAGITSENQFRKQLNLLSKMIYKVHLLPWLCGVGIMWFWHIPFIFNYLMLLHDMNRTANAANILMSIHLLSLLISGMLFCWPVINPYHHYRMEPLTGVLYLSTACMGCSLLGLLITFAPAETYTNYITGMNGDSYLSMIRTVWKISASSDQQMGGLIMWVPCCFVYLSACMMLLIKWFNGKTIILQATTQMHTH